MQTLLSLSVALFAGLMLSRLTKIWNLPAVTAYLVAGILIGPFVLGQLGVSGLGFTSLEEVESMSLISDVALGFIAIAMGNEFRLSELKKIGKQAVVIAILQAVAAALLVDAALIGLYFIMPDAMPLSCAITLGAIATATAPAATLMVIKQYKAEGPLTRILLPIVALDDVVGLIVFAVSFGISRAILTEHLDIVSILVNPLIEIVASLALGALLGFLFHVSEKFFHSRSKRMSISVGFVLLAVALSKMPAIEIGSVHIAFSTLLVCMMLGTVFCNLCDFSEELMDRIDRWVGPIMVLFFVLSGSELKLTVFTDWHVVLIGVVFIIFRSAGKILGAKYSSRLMHCTPSIQKYLGITLLPQAGVCLGMSLTAMHAMTQIGTPEAIQAGVIIRNISLFAVLIYELIGPMLTKIALDRAGEIPEKPIPERLQAEMAKK